MACRVLAAGLISAVKGPGSACTRPMQMMLGSIFAKCMQIVRKKGWWLHGETFCCCFVDWCKEACQGVRWDSLWWLPGSCGCLQMLRIDTKQ
jgi:hypothetical protein